MLAAGVARECWALDQENERLRAGAFDLQRKKMIRARSAEIDNSDRLAHRISPFAEPESRVHHERGPDHEHGIRVFQRRQRIIDTYNALIGFMKLADVEVPKN